MDPFDFLNDNNSPLYLFDDECDDYEDDPTSGGLGDEITTNDNNWDNHFYDHAFDAPTLPYGNGDLLAPALPALALPAPALPTPALPTPALQAPALFPGATLGSGGIAVTSEGLLDGYCGLYEPTSGGPWSAVGLDDRGGMPGEPENVSTSLFLTTCHYGPPFPATNAVSRVGHVSPAPPPTEPPPAPKRPINSPLEERAPKRGRFWKEDAELLLPESPGEYLRGPLQPQDLPPQHPFIIAQAGPPLQQYFTPVHLTQTSTDPHWDAHSLSPGSTTLTFPPPRPPATPSPSDFKSKEGFIAAMDYLSTDRTSGVTKSGACYFLNNKKALGGKMNQLRERCGVKVFAKADSVDEKFRNSREYFIKEGNGYLVRGGLNAAVVEKVRSYFEWLGMNH